jgi:hypothetical protein
MPSTHAVVKYKLGMAIRAANTNGTDTDTTDTTPIAAPVIPVPTVPVAADECDALRAKLLEQQQCIDKLVAANCTHAAI